MQRPKTTGERAADFLILALSFVLALALLLGVGQTASLIGKSIGVLMFTLSLLWVGAMCVIAFDKWTTSP